MSRLGDLTRLLSSAEKNVQAELERQFPLDKRISFLIMSGQCTPSQGHVIGYSGGVHAYLRVRLASRTSQVRDVSAFDVIGGVK